MFRTDQNTAVTALPVPAPAGTPGYFTGGNPATGQAATILDADWLNMVQEELIGILAAAGIAPGKTTYNQVLTALKVLFVQPNQLYGGAKGIATFTSSTTWVSPFTGTAYVSGCAGGGGGGASPGSAANQSIGGCGGGGAGQSVYRIPINVTKGQSYAVTIGAAGASASAGGNSSFGTLLTLTGGSPGSSATAGAATSYLAGAIGGAGYPYGSFGDDTGPVGAGGVSGFGASSPFGGGGGQVRGVIAGTPLIAGLGASGYGGGGGGAGGNYPGGSTSFAASAGAPGGGGAPGLFVVEW
ncbi:hypothetical protein KDX27_22855 [Burkholderia cenocepacia]|uniref:hypothetical protein n=1 Tax=Burkholderia cenocepacia TaxID=95486 RepID=UPI001B9E0EC1|nr:hypothetical protein [Burkholderia cenocepacia]MBR8170579.1 hypothetical protein [Burkholderia cenocepacia]